MIAGVLFAIGINRLDPRNLAPRETMRQLEKDKDTVKGNGAMSSTKGSFVDSVVTAAQENPVAAALIGVAPSGC